MSRPASLKETVGNGLTHALISLKQATPERRNAAPGLNVPFSGDDAALVHAILDGNSSAKAELFRRYASQLERLLRHQLGRDTELADILQETFAAALRSLAGLNDPSALKPWLFRVGMLTARNALRSRSRRRWLLSSGDEENEARYEARVEPLDAEALHAARAVHAILARFSVDERSAFVLRYIDGAELTTVAAACGISLSTVKRRLQRTEHRFITAARNAPALAVWIERGTRWKTRSG